MSCIRYRPLQPVRARPAASPPGSAHNATLTELLVGSFGAEGMTLGGGPPRVFGGPSLCGNE